MLYILEKFNYEIKQFKKIYVSSSALVDLSQVIVDCGKR